MTPRNHLPREGRTTREPNPTSETTMSNWRKARVKNQSVPDERAWSAHTSVHPRAAREDLVRYTALPAETGPTWAPDRLSIWPVEGGRFGIDAHYHGQTGIERAKGQRHRLERQGIPASVKSDDHGGLLRLGPLAHEAVWIALEAFLGRPVKTQTD
jgi:hypothetical protein